MAQEAKLNHGFAIDATIREIETSTAFLIDVQDHITLAQFRRIKLARHALADFLVSALKVDADPKPTETEACNAAIEGTKNRCTRDAGHPGEHRCLAVDVDNRRKRYHSDTAVSP